MAHPNIFDIPGSSFTTNNHKNYHNNDILKASSLLSEQRKEPTTITTITTTTEKTVADPSSSSSNNDKAFFITFFTVLSVFILFLIVSAILLFLFLKKRKRQTRGEVPVIVQEKRKQKQQQRQSQKQQQQQQLQTNTKSSSMSAVDHVPSSTSNVHDNAEDRNNDNNGNDDDDDDSQTIHTNADDLSAMLSKSTKSQLISRDELLSRRSSIEDMLMTQQIVDVMPAEDKMHGSMSSFWGALLYSTTLSETVPFGGQTKLMLAPPVSTITQRVYEVLQTTKKNRQNPKLSEKQKRRRKRQGSFVQDIEEEEEDEVDVETGNKIRKKPKYKTEHIVEDSKCAICTQDYQIGEWVCFSSNRECPHVFHKKCMVRWLSRTPNCPTCWRCYFDMESAGMDLDDSSITS